MKQHKWHKECKECESLKQDIDTFRKINQDLINKEWQGLSEEDINLIQGGFYKGQYYIHDLIKAIEQKLKEKNHVTT